MGFIGILTVLGVILFVTRSKKKASTSLFEYSACLDDHMPTDIKAEANYTLQVATDPDELDATAASADLNGYPKFAACLREKARQLRQG